MMPMAGTARFASTLEDGAADEEPIVQEDHGSWAGREVLADRGGSGGYFSGDAGMAAAAIHRLSVGAIGLSLLAAIASASLLVAGRPPGLRPAAPATQAAVGLSSDAQAGLDQQLSRLAAGVTRGNSTAEERLEAGAAAFAAHLFGPKPPVTTTTTTAPSKQQSAGSSRSSSASWAPAYPKGTFPVHGNDWYRVNVDAVVRAGEATGSAKISVAPAGLFVHIAEKRGRRVRVDRAATSLLDSRLVSGWMSTHTSGGHGGIEILRRSRQAKMPLPGSAKSVEDSLKFREMRNKLEKQAVLLSKVTANNKRLDDSLHKVNATDIAHTVTYVSKHPQRYEQAGIKTARKAGEHLEEDLETGAGKLLAAIDRVVPGMRQNATQAGGKIVNDTVHEVDLDLPAGMGEALHNMLKQTFK